MYSDKFYNNSLEYCTSAFSMVPHGEPCQTEYLEKDFSIYFLKNNTDLYIKIKPQSG